MDRRRLRVLVAVGLAVAASCCPALRGARAAEEARAKPGEAPVETPAATGEATPPATPPASAVAGEEARPGQGQAPKSRPWMEWGRGGPWGVGKPGAGGKGKGVEREAFRRQYEKMSPEERERFKSNLQDWSKMSAEERSNLRSNAHYLQARMRREIDQALGSSGLNLSQEERERFVRRYIQRRAEIERQLHHEMDRMRRGKIVELVEELKRDFPRGTDPAPGAARQGAPAPEGAGAIQLNGAGTQQP